MFKSIARWRLHYLSRRDLLQQVAVALPLEEVSFRRYPLLTLVGNYCGLRVAIEIRKKKSTLGKVEGFSYLVTIEPHRSFLYRVFVQNEARKTKFKPVASLKLVHTAYEPFNEHFLLLSDREEAAQKVFQEYLCRRVLDLTEKNWQIDLYGNIAHVELWQEKLEATNTVAWLRLMFEIVNLFAVAV